MLFVSDLDLYCRQPEIDFKTIVMGEHLGSGSVGEVSLGGVERRRRAEKNRYLMRDIKVMIFSYT